MAMPDSLRDPALDRVELANTLVRVRSLEERINLLERIIGRPAVRRLIEREERREGTKDQRRRMICDLAARLPPGNPAAMIRQFERLFTGKATPPDGAAHLVADLRRDYGNGGPCPNTIRTALQKFQLS